MMTTRNKKTLFDFLAVLSLSWVILPIFLVVALAIRRQSPGPVFFRQWRVGLHEKLFRIYKFRTMVINAENLGTSVTTSGDARITSIGRVLRRTKLDELPQLLNVFKGEMSLVGPRPDVPEIVDTYTEEMRRLFLVKPGITSVATLHLVDEERFLAQVPDPDMFYEKVLVPVKVRLAMEHVQQDSFRYDLIILLQTLWKLTLGRWWPIPEHALITELKAMTRPARGPR